MTEIPDNRFFLELIPMRPDERIDPEVVGSYLRGKIPDSAGTPKILQFNGGRANLTYLLQYPNREYVLRRPPLGPVAPKSHDMERESRVLLRLHKAYPLAPLAYLFCSDPEIVGAPFFVMERRRGIVIRESMPERFKGQPELFRRMSEMIVDGLAELHGVDPKSIGLEELGRPQGYVERQIKGWHSRWEGAKNEDVPDFYRMYDWLLERIPLPQRESLVHNDYKLDNMMVDAEDPSKCVAVFDWDMCTLGDPFIDLGTLLSYWVQPSDSQMRISLSPMPTAQPGFYTREEVTKRYAEKSGLDLGTILFYEIFAMWKSVVVIQQIFIRLHRGQTQDTRFADYNKRALGLLDVAWELVKDWDGG